MLKKPSGTESKMLLHFWSKSC